MQADFSSAFSALQFASAMSVANSASAVFGQHDLTSTSLSLPSASAKLSDLCHLVRFAICVCGEFC